MSENILPTRENYRSGVVSPIGRAWGLTKNVPFPNLYIKMLPEFKNWIYLEEEAVELKGQWKNIFEKPEQPLDLEIGCGNGFFFGQQVEKNPSRNLLGIELKYKPLVQTIRRVKDKSLTNGRGIRFHAGYIDGIFASQELHKVFIYFPDPWPKKRQKKNRLLNKDFFTKLNALQKPGQHVDFKTDSEDYFDFVFEELKSTPYKIIGHTRDLHRSEWAPENFLTSFEKIFASKGQPIYFMRLSKLS